MWHRFALPEEGALEMPIEEVLLSLETTYDAEPAQVALTGHHL
jgi:hypothetical protein